MHPENPSGFMMMLCRSVIDAISRWSYWYNHPGGRHDGGKEK